MRNKLLNYTVPVLLFLSITFINAQTVHSVAVGDTNAVKAAYESASAGDIIELTTDGGVYWFNTNITVEKDITIRGNSALTKKPILKYRTSSTSKYFIKGAGSPRITLENLEFDGDATDEAGISKVAYMVRLENGDTTNTMSLFVDNVVAHDFRDKFIKPYALTGMDSLVVTNSIFYNGEKEGIVFYSGTSADPPAKINYAEVSNCTFYALESEAIKGQTYAKMKVLLDHNTFYDIGEVDKKPILYFRQMTDVVVQNSIFVKNHNADVTEEFADFTSDACIFRNNAVYDVTNSAVDKATVTDTVHVDPGFADPVNGDFSLPLTSSLLTFGTDGGPIGDLRWIPEMNLHLVGEGEATIKDAYDAAEDGDILELTTSGGIYTFGSSDKIEIKKKITIRAQEGLAKKPILRQTKTGSSSRRHFDVLAGGELTLQGLILDGKSGVDGDPYIAKDAVRLNPGDSTAVSLWVEDCEFTDFSEPFIKGYGKAVVDTIVVKNSIFANGGREGIMLYENSTNGGPAVHYGEISNITMSNVTREAIKVEMGTDPNAKIIVDHATFYNIGDGGKSVLRFKDITDVTVKNSIISKNLTPDDPPDKFADFDSDLTGAGTIINTVVWDVNNFETNAATVTDTLNVDPEFMDPANGNFLLPESSTLLTYATDGKAVGDTRWDPANFDGYLLTVEVVGNGTVAKSPSAASYFPGTEVTLTATPATNWIFTGWSDNIVVFPVDNPVAKVTMNDNVDVTATFAPDANEYNVTIASIGYGHVVDTTYSDFGDIAGFYAGDSVVMEAVVDSTNWEFAYWVNAAGDSVADNAKISYIVTADTTFKAMFRSTLEQVAFNLTVVGEDGGDLSVSPLPVPGFTTYDINTVVTLIADAIIGWEFNGYSGDVTETGDTLEITLSADKTVTATFAEISHPNGILAIDDTWEMQDALDYAHNNSQVDTIKLTSVGPYLPDEEDRGTSDGRMEYLELNSPIAIVGDPTLSTKPVIKGYTSSTGSNSSSGFFRFRAGSGKLTLRNLVIDGFLDESTDAYSAKYIFRVDDGSDSVFCSLDAENVDFYNCNEAFWKNYGYAAVDTIKFENCFISGVGKEAFYLKAVGNVNHIDITNTTFEHVGRQIIYMIGMAPTVVVDHVTIDSCGLGYGTEGAKFPAFRIEDNEDVTISNSIISNVPYSTSTTGYVIRISGANSTVENVLFFNTPEKIDLKDDATLGNDNFWYDPMFVGADSGNYTLADASIAYHMANDGKAAVGDLRWATSTSVASYNALDLTVGDNGTVTQNPAPMGKFYVPNTVVTLTADVDTLYKFGGWSGDATGTDLTTTVTLDADKAVSASFLQAYYALLMNVNLSFWATESMFDPAADTVVIKRGNVVTELEDADGDSIYSGTLKIDENVPAFEWVFGIVSSTNAHEETVTRSFTATEDTTLTFWYNYDDPALGLAGELQPVVYELSQNYPNPFNPTTTINFALVNPGLTTLKVYDIMGREIATLVDREMDAGNHSIVFHIPNLASGMYIYRLESGNFRAVKKMIMMK